MATAPLSVPLWWNLRKQEKSLREKAADKYNLLAGVDETPAEGLEDADRKAETRWATMLNMLKPTGVRLGLEQPDYLGVLYHAFDAAYAAADPVRAEVQRVWKQAFRVKEVDAVQSFLWYLDVLKGDLGVPLNTNIHIGLLGLLYDWTKDESTVADGRELARCSLLVPSNYVKEKPSAKAGARSALQLRFVGTGKPDWPATLAVEMSLVDVPSTDEFESKIEIFEAAGSADAWETAAKDRGWQWKAGTASGTVGCTMWQSTAQPSLSVFALTCHLSPRAFVLSKALREAESLFAFQKPLVQGQDTKAKVELVSGTRAITTSEIPLTVPTLVGATVSVQSVQWSPTSDGKDLAVYSVDSFAQWTEQWARMPLEAASVMGELSSWNLTSTPRTLFEKVFFDWGAKRSERNPLFVGGWLHQRLLDVLLRSLPSPTASSLAPRLIAGNARVSHPRFSFPLERLNSLFQMEPDLQDLRAVYWPSAEKPFLIWITTAWRSDVKLGLTSKWSSATSTFQPFAPQAAVTGPLRPDLTGVSVKVAPNVVVSLDPPFPDEATAERLTKELVLAERPPALSSDVLTFWHSPAADLKSGDHSRMWSYIHPERQDFEAPFKRAWKRFQEAGLASAAPSFCSWYLHTTYTTLQSCFVNQVFVTQRIEIVLSLAALKRGSFVDWALTEHEWSALRLYIVSLHHSTIQRAWEGSLRYDFFPCYLPCCPIALLITYPEAKTLLLTGLQQLSTSPRLVDWVSFLSEYLQKSRPAAALLDEQACATFATLWSSWDLSAQPPGDKWPSFVPLEPALASFGWTAPALGVTAPPSGRVNQELWYWPIETATQLGGSPSDRAFIRRLERQIWRGVEEGTSTFTNAAHGWWASFAKLKNKLSTGTRQRFQFCMTKANPDMERVLRLTGGFTWDHFVLRFPLPYATVKAQVLDFLSDLLNPLSPNVSLWKLFDLVWLVDATSNVLCWVRPPQNPPHPEEWNEYVFVAAAPWPTTISDAAVFCHIRTFPRKIEPDIGPSLALTSVSSVLAALGSSGAVQLQWQPDWTARGGVPVLQLPGTSVPPSITPVTWPPLPAPDTTQPAAPAAETDILRILVEVLRKAFAVQTGLTTTELSVYESASDTTLGLEVKVVSPKLSVVVALPKGRVALSLPSDQLWRNEVWRKYICNLRAPNDLVARLFEAMFPTQTLRSRLYRKNCFILESLIPFPLRA